MVSATITLRIIVRPNTTLIISPMKAGISYPKSSPAMEIRISLEIEISPKLMCLYAFKAGRNVCPGSCSQRHNLDFAKIRRGICFFEFAEKGSCKRSAEECWFTHDIPEVLRMDVETKYHISRSLDKIQKLRHKSQKNKLPVNIRIFNHQQDNFLPQMQRPMLQNSLPRPPAWSPHPLILRNP